MRSALIGFTGFVGSSLLRTANFDDLFRSTNIGDIAGGEYGLLVCAGAPAAKWKANQAPEDDWANLRRLIVALDHVRADTAVLISTVDVYGAPDCVYEDSAPAPEAATAYGRHRYYLEESFRGRFQRTVILRLPGLFGRGLRKNFIFDLLKNPAALNGTDHRSVFQFYDMSRLWSDIQTAVQSGEPLVHLATPPLRADEVARECFGASFTNVTAGGPVYYDMRTRHAGLFGGRGDYIIEREDVIRAITTFAVEEKQSGKS